MSSETYRVESAHPIVSPIWFEPSASSSHYVADRSQAIVLAAKSRSSPPGHEIRVVHVPTGKIVFRKTDGSLSTTVDD
jgi:hypothetical protein